jgi:hypothetical protein
VWGDGEKVLNPENSIKDLAQILKKKEHMHIAFTY